LFRLATGQARRSELESDCQVRIDGDTRAARRFLDGAEGTWLETGEA
jgi:hypothetical protein